MKKYVCTVCGYIAEGEIPAQCPVCKAPASAFVEKTGNTYVTEHVVGLADAHHMLGDIGVALLLNKSGGRSLANGALSRDLALSNITTDGANIFLHKNRPPSFSD